METFKQVDWSNIDQFAALKERTIFGKCKECEHIGKVQRFYDEINGSHYCTKHFHQLKRDRIEQKNLEAHTSR